jgi:hypothetical protein
MVSETALGSETGRLCQSLNSFCCVLGYADCMDWSDEQNIRWENCVTVHQKTENVLTTRAYVKIGRAVMDNVLQEKTDLDMQRSELCIVKACAT